MSINPKYLFNVNAYSTDLIQVQDTLPEAHLSQFNIFLRFIREQVGNVLAFDVHPYRVMNTSYIKWHIQGENDTLTVTFVIAGYTEWPKLDTPSPRLYFFLADTTDYYWLSEVIQAQLRIKTSLNTNNLNEEDQSVN